MARTNPYGKSASASDINALMVAAGAADRQGDFRTAVMLCGQVLVIDPSFIPARILSAVVHLKSGHVEAAEAKFLSILRSAPNHFQAHLWLGTLYSRHGRAAEAISMAEKAIQINQADKDAHFLLARTLFEEGRLRESKSELEKTLSIKEDIGEAHSLLGSILQQLGDMEAAETALMRAIQLEPRIGPAYYDLVLGRKITREDRPLLDRFEKAAALDGLRPRDRSRIEFALGKACDDLQEYGEAISHYDKANELALLVMNRGGVVFSPEKMADDFQRAKHSSSLWEGAPAGSDSEQPVLILGMMRSGTTLLEQILSSHNQIAGAGELNFWFDRVGPFHLEQRAPSLEEAQAIASDYIRALHAAGGQACRITDKTPHNFIALGWIHAVFPNARIIHCRRRLIDSCLSIYMTPFRVPPEFGHSRENIVAFARQYEELMNHWRQVLPSDRFMEIDYEDLVANTEAVTRRTLEFLGLDWGEACLRHELNAKAVRTPSLWQVRQPIYRGSVERWRRYEPWLGVFRELIP